MRVRCTAKKWLTLKKCAQREAQRKTQLKPIPSSSKARELIFKPFFLSRLICIWIEAVAFNRIHRAGREQILKWNSIHNITFYGTAIGGRLRVPLNNFMNWTKLYNIRLLFNDAGEHINRALIKIERCDTAWKWCVPCHRLNATKMKTSISPGRSIAARHSKIRTRNSSGTGPLPMTQIYSVECEYNYCGFIELSLAFTHLFQSRRRCLSNCVPRTRWIMLFIAIRCFNRNQINLGTIKSDLGTRWLFVPARKCTDVSEIKFKWPPNT